MTLAPAIWTVMPAPTSGHVRQQIGTLAPRRRRPRRVAKKIAKRLGLAHHRDLPRNRATFAVGPCNLADTVAVLLDILMEP